MSENKIVLDMIDVLKGILKDVQRLKVDVQELQIELNRFKEIAPCVHKEVEKKKVKGGQNKLRDKSGDWKEGSCTHCGTKGIIYLSTSGKWICKECLDRSR
jgi:PHP family Zn ribbon phosphoesterase